MESIQITVINSLGTFVGCLQHTDGSTDIEGARETMTVLQLNVNSMRDLTIVEVDGTEVTFTKGALEGAVIKFKLVELPL